MKDTKLNLATAIIQELGDTYRNRKRELNRAEKSLYEASLKIACRALLPRGEVGDVIRAYDDELNDERSRAENARKARAEKPAAAQIGGVA